MSQGVIELICAFALLSGLTIQGGVTHRLDDPPTRLDSALLGAFVVLGLVGLINA